MHRPQDPLTPRQRVTLMAILGVAILFKLWALWRGGWEPDADEATVGLMAQAALQGRFTIFYWGQPYMAPVESWVLAPVLALTGPSALAIKGVALAFFVLFLLSVLALGRRTVGMPATLWALAVLAASPLFLHIWGLKLRGGFVSLCAAGNVLLVFAVDAASPRQPASTDPVRRGALWGAAMGALLYWYFFAVEYVLPALLLLAQTRPGWKYRLKAIPSAMVAAAITFCPVVVYNLSDGTTGATVNYFSATASPTADEVKTHIRRLGTIELPILAGIIPPWEEDLPTDGAGDCTVVLVLGGLGLLALLALVLHGLRAAAMWARAESGFANGWAPHAMVALASASAFVLTQFGDWLEPRFLLPLYTPLALALGDVLVRSKRLAPVLLAAYAACTTWGAVRVGAHLWHIPIHRAQLDRPFPAAEPLATTLLQRGLVGIYGDYWICKPLFFFTQQRLACRDQGPRTPWMKARVEQRSIVEKAWLRDQGRNNLLELEDLLGSLGMSAQRFVVDRLVVLHHITPSPRAVPRHAVRWSSTHGQDALPLLADLDVDSRWSSRTAQEDAAVTLTAHLDGPRCIQRISLYSGPQDYPRALTVMGSQDGEAWVELAYEQPRSRPPAGVLQVNLHPMWVDRLALEVPVTPRVELWWSVHEAVLWPCTDG